MVTADTGKSIRSIQRGLACVIVVVIQIIKHSKIMEVAESKFANDGNMILLRFLLM